MVSRKYINGQEYLICSMFCCVLDYNIENDLNVICVYGEWVDFISKDVIDTKNI